MADSNSAIEFSLGRPIVGTLAPSDEYLEVIRKSCAKYTIVFLGDLPWPRERKFFQLLIAGAGATIRSSVNNSVNLVITTKSLDSKDDVQMLVSAEARGIQIISYEWLDDLILTGKAAPTWHYAVYLPSIKCVSDESRAAFINQETLNFQHGCRLAAEEMGGTDIYHLYRGPDGFQYDIALTRFRDDINETEVIRLRVFEHHVSGSLWTVASFHLPHPRRPLDFRISHKGTHTMPVMSPFGFFEYMFKGATGYSWKWRRWGFKAEIAGYEGPSQGLKIDPPMSCWRDLEKGKENEPVCEVPPMGRAEYNAMVLESRRMQDGFVYTRPVGVDGVDPLEAGDGRRLWGLPPKSIGRGGGPIFK